MLTRIAFKIISIFSPVLATKLVVMRYAGAAPVRPRPWSMAHNFTSWLGLTDLRYNGRHMDEDPEFAARKDRGLRPNPGDPDENEPLLNLFLRNGRPQQDCERSSVLFLFFAQWFTDAFLRTDAIDHRFTDSNHEIDFCALYGLTKEKTDMLRFQVKDESGNVVRGEDGSICIDPERAHLLAWDESKSEMFPPKLYELETSGDDKKLRFRPEFRRETQVAQEDSAVPVTEYLHGLGHMKRITHGQSPEDVAQNYYAMGLEHGNGTLGYVVLNILMLRAHNKMAEEIWEANKGKDGWDKERVFHTTRCVLTFILLKIVVEDYVSHISGLALKTPIGMADKAHWGKPNRIAIEFNLLYRWHALVPDNLIVDGKVIPPDLFRRHPELVEVHGLEKLLSEFSKQPAGRIGLRNYPDFFARRSTPEALSTVERTLWIAHEAKLRPMNQYREHYGLTGYNSFEDLVGDQPGADALVKELKELYKNINDVDWFVGMLAEKHAKPIIMGELMTTMVANDAFTQALTNPLLSKRIFDTKDGGAEAVFSEKGLEIIGKISTLQELSDYVLGPYKAKCSFSV